MKMLGFIFSLFLCLKSQAEPPLREGCVRSKDLRLAASHVDSKEELVVKLLRDLGQLTCWNTDLPPVKILILPKEQMCKLLGCTVKAAYIPDPQFGLVLSESLDPETKDFDRSILFHELVHYVQVTYNSFDNPDGCIIEKRRETEAYSLQQSYLKAIGNNSAVMFSGVPMCR